ncbi:MAG TPA: glycosyltransferase family 2 protein [Saprospiraceae bacterium]|nr:glycosyltransferase family 2 protein [Saprospiraceae bacterium]HPN69646.1 glycosyltransferase family 2 protein [Saprospiraceae bacterium]
MLEQKLKLCIITPAFNPSKDEIGFYCANIKSIHEAIGGLYDLTFIVVDDGSEEEISLPKSSTAYRSLLRHDVNKGKGAAIKTGVKFIQNTDIVVYTDFDFPYVLNNMYDMIDLMVSQDADIMVAKRSQAYFSKLPLQRKVISKLLLFVNKYVMGLDHYDTQGGLKVLNAKNSDLLLSTRSNGFLFEIEFIYAAQSVGLKILDYVVQLRADVLIPPISWQSIVKNIRALFVILVKRKY